MVKVDERCVEVTEMLIDALGLDDVDVENVNFEASLFASADENEEGLGLDSVDALEIVVAIRNTYGIKMTDEEKKYLSSIRSIADFLDEKLKGDEGIE